MSLTLVLLACATGAALAFNNTVNLGKQTNAVPTGHFQLGGFIRMRAAFGTAQRPEVLFIGTQLPQDKRSAAERWPVVKALSQFGTFTGVRPLERRCIPVRGTKRRVCTSLPTFDWSHAQYRSRYLAFVHKDLLTPDARPLQRLSPAEQRLYDRYARVSSAFGMDPGGIMASVSNRASTRTLPLLAIGRYVQTMSQIMDEGDFETTVALPLPNSSSSIDYSTPTSLSFATVHDALVRGHDPKNAPTCSPKTGTIGCYLGSLNNDVNAEANLITALVCHADRLQPRQVCTRPGVRAILRRVR